ncbi:MAG: energy-coupling factor transporter transmembrane component T [Anaerostipes sp.]|nr:energy-coupling factor transporter transmembrane component T [Anaerostipes sp.]
MDKKTAIETYHPWIIFSYFVGTIGAVSVFFHPVYLFIAAASGLWFYYQLYDHVKIVKQMLSGGGIILFVTLLNGLWNHQGVTILWYLGDNPVTKEALIYGVMNGLFFYSIFLWFACFSKVMTEDKIHYLFGSIIPTFALIFSMVLGMIPKIKQHFEEVRYARRQLGKTPRTMREHIKESMSVVSVTTTWILEHSVDTADSMKARGYGTRRRTCFHMYRYDMRDCVFTLIVVGLFSINIICYTLGEGRIQCFPMIHYENVNGIGLLGFSLLFLLPEIVQMKENYVWKHMN